MPTTQKKLAGIRNGFAVFDIYIIIFLCDTDILDLAPPQSNLGTIIRIDLWTYDVIHVCNLGKL